MAKQQTHTLGFMDSEEGESDGEFQMKWILIFTFPNGQRFAASQKDGYFCIVPIIDGKFKGAMGWDTAMEVKEFLMAFRKEVGDEEFKKWWSLRPEARKVQLL